MAEPQFTRVSGTELYWLQSSGRTIGFQATSGSSIGDSPALSQTWTSDTGGIYFFLAEAPTASDGDFETSLLSYLDMQGWPSGQKFLWLENPNAPVSSWAGQLLNAAQSGSIWTVSRRADFRFINYALTVTSGSVITLATEAQNWGFAFANSSIPVATFFGPNTSYNANDSMLLLPFAGSAIACWRLAITLSNPDDFQQLGIGIRYFYPYQALPSERNVYIAAINLPTIFQPLSPLNLDVSLNSLHPLDPDRSYFSLVPLNPALPIFDTMFATAHGYGVELQPLAAAGATPDARFVFAEQPRYVGADDEVPKDFYLTLQGAFSIEWKTTAGTLTDGDDANSIHRLLCGMSGLEYLGMPDDGASIIEFIPGQNAYAPLLPSEESGDPLTGLGTTAWVWASTNNADQQVSYFAQPEDAPLYKAPPASAARADDNLGSVFLDFLEMPALLLAASDGTRAFPLAPYNHLAADEIEDAKKVEAAAIAPARRQAILAADHSWRVTESEAPTDTETIGVTPQGISVGVASNGMDWTWTGIANDSDSTADRPDLVFTKVTGAFRQALETNRLFMVLSNADVFMNDSSVQYQLTAEGIAEIEAEGTVPANVLAQVKTYFSNLGYPTYENETDFDAALVAATPDAAPYELIFERQSGLLVPRIDDWHFQISPRNWDNPERTEGQHVMVIYKFSVGRSLAELTADLPSWTWPEAAAFPGGAAADAQAELQSIYEQARVSFAQTSGGGKQSPYANFIGILDNPNWTGIIAFGAGVPLNQLPAPLQALAAGIDSKRFYAHHVGFNVTPYGANPGTLIFGRTSMFGLLDYQDPADQYFESTIYYAFKVLQLTVGFRNSVMTDFSSKVELLINRLFGMPSLLFPSQHGNNVILNGVYQRQTDSQGVEHGTYVFTMDEQNTFSIDNAALRNVVLLSTQLVTTRPADPAHPEQTVISQFQMGGNLYYYAPANLDLFSFGADPLVETTGDVSQSSSALRFGNLIVQMEFTMANPTPVFTFLTETLSFDLVNSKPRLQALYASFPLSLSSFIATPDPVLQNPPLPPSQATAQSPESMGYISITAGVQQSKMLDPWYGLVFDIDLGTLGALAGSAGLVLKLLLGWSDGGTRDEPAVYVGVRLPGIKDAIGVELPLQGVITLAFRTIEMIVNNREDTGKREYMLRFRNFAMKFLSLSFPPGYNDIYLFGNPDQTTPTKLGWYAAYSAEQDDKKNKKLSPTARRVNARKLPAATLTRRKNN
ncbi:MAG TPA: hypothetical protein VJT15_06150 [Pyrinomonadaceae bacterium]|nr:hypothetical protein [Pyrinomonadaceae bacterium]